MAASVGTGTAWSLAPEHPLIGAGSGAGVHAATISRRHCGGGRDAWWCLVSAGIPGRAPWTWSRTGYAATAPRATRRGNGTSPPPAAASARSACTGRPITLDQGTGEVLDVYTSTEAPDGVVYKACGTRRASLCPACAETYRHDAYQLLRAGIAGSDSAGVPASITGHPLVFLTLTAPSFGPVHSLRSRNGQPRPCRARRDKPLCPHGRPAWCRQRHRVGEACLGRPLCPDCYDYDAHVIWNHHAPELWRRTTITLRRAVDKLGRAHEVRLRISFGKVAEYQARGVVHYHALIRLDALTGSGRGGAAGAAPGLLHRSVARGSGRGRGPGHRLPHTAAPRLPERRRVAAHLGRPDRRAPRPRRSRARRDPGRAAGPRPRRRLLPGQVRHQSHRSRRAARPPAHRIHRAAVRRRHPPRPADRRLLATRPTRSARTQRRGGSARLRPATRLGAHARLRRALPDQVPPLLHHLHRTPAAGASPGAAATTCNDSAKPSTSGTWPSDDDEETTLVIGAWTYAGNGWLTTGDQLLAVAAAARAREHRAIAREEARSVMHDEEGMAGVR